MVFLSVAIFLVLTVYQHFWFKSKLKSKDDEHKREIETLVWKHDSNLKLLQKTVKTRVSNLTKQNREKEEECKLTVAAIKNKETEIKRSYEDTISKVTKYKVWKLTVKQGMESTVYPDRAIIIADSRETAEHLITLKYSLDDVNIIYDIVQSRREKNEILLESYDIL